MGNPVGRFIVLVLDSAGIGAQPDAKAYGDADADTLGHIFSAMGKDYQLPNMAALGLYHMLHGRSPAAKTDGSWGRMRCASPAKDTTAGHWELAGIVLDKAFPTYPHGFPPDVIEAFEARTGTKVIGNCTASGTEIIQRLGDEHVRTGRPIVYTSADSVFQIAAHEETFGLERLYDLCRTARELLTGQHAVGRVIARPFVGTSGSYTRTANRRDFSLTPFGPTILDRVCEAGGTVTAVGKISDIFNGRGITRHLPSHSNREGMWRTLEALAFKDSAPALVFINLVDFDMLWGHRRDVNGYAAGLKEFDGFLPALRAAMREDDVLAITADHGCDPTYTKHTDHTREQVPLLLCGSRVKAGVDLGTRSSFADLAQTIADCLGLAPMARGTSFRKELGL